MLHFQNQVQIDRPLEEVFPFAAAPENFPKWNYYVLSVTRTSPGNGGVGAEYHQVRREDEQRLRVVAYEPNQQFVIATIPPSRPEARREMIFARANGGTLITDSWQLSFGKFGPLEQLAAGRVKNAVAENLARLKELLEKGHTRLQDGRRVTLG